jgi:hypothetical protein
VAEADTAEDKEVAGREGREVEAEAEAEVVVVAGAAEAGKAGTGDRGIRAICYRNRGHTFDE